MTAPRVAIVIPIYGHSILADEAIAAALALSDGAGPAPLVIAVDDGCKLPETRATLAGWSARAPDRFVALHQPNRGLSGARNTGIRYALETYPSVEAVFPLDSDNRLDSYAGELFSHLLDTHPDIDWFYPPYDMFGLNSTAHAIPVYSTALLAESNLCEAGSLIRRRVFEAGTWYDESMRGGYEDWDFYLSAAGRGFAGHPVGRSFFRYRKRPESMLSGSHDNDAQLRRGLQRKHGWLFGRDRVHQIVARETPRTVLIDTGAADTGAGDDPLTLFTDPAQPQTTTAEAEVGRFLAARARPTDVWAPSSWCFARPGMFDALSDVKLAQSVLWYMQNALYTCDLVAVRVVPDPDQRLSIDRIPAAKDPKAAAGAAQVAKRVAHVDEVHYEVARAAEAEAVQDADILMVSSDKLRRRMVFPNVQKPDLIKRFARHAIKKARVTRLTVHMPAPPARAGNPPVAALNSWITRLREDPRADGRWNAMGHWRDAPKISGPHNLDWVVRRHTLGAMPFPIVRTEGARHIGFVLPIFLFGGAEKCVVALARSLRAQGVHCHLFVYGTDPIAANPWLTDPFETVHHMADPALRDWRGPQYAGTNLGTEPKDSLLKDLIAPLAGMEAVITSGAAVLYHGLAALRAKGVRVLSWEHLIESGGYGRSYGTPYLGVGYEGGLDGILTCSHRLADWMTGQGVPRAKLQPLPNGPGFPLSPDAVAAALATRADRPADARLRVGFLGRFDGAKGADRYIEIATRCAALPIDFSITGGKVIGGDPDLRVPDQVTRYPAAYDIDALKDAFARIDVLLMPSRDEGLPLTIMEAQRVGVIPVATDVGAVSEAIIDGETGFLIRGSGVVDQMTALLTRLATEPELARTVSGRAARLTGQWDKNATSLLALLDRLQS